MPTGWRNGPPNPRHDHVLTAAPIATPCTGVCRIDADRRCAGCARTLDEIARWATMHPAERAAIMAALPGRRRA